MKTRKIKLVSVILIMTPIILGCSQSTVIQQPTAPLPTFAPLPTETPLPTATLIPTMEPIPGWTKFSAGGVEIMLPESYIGGNLKDDVGVIVARLREQGPNFEPIAQSIEQNPDIYVIWASDSKVSPSGFISNVNVTREQVLSTMTLDTYMDTVERQLPPEFRIVGRNDIDLSGYAAGQLVVEFNISGVKGQELVYVLKDNSNIWVITYATGKDDYDQQLPIFELSAHTFRIVSH